MPKSPIHPEYFLVGTQNLILSISQDDFSPDLFKDISRVLSLSDMQFVIVESPH